jgi:hypothetical protein
MKAALMQFIGSANWYRCGLNRKVMETVRNRHGEIAGLGHWGSIVLCAMLTLPCAADAQPAPPGSPAPLSPVTGDAPPPAQSGGSGQIGAAPHLMAPTKIIGLSNSAGTKNSPVLSLTDITETIELIGAGMNLRQTDGHGVTK